jgi:hypothetical protein
MVRIKLKGVPDGTCYFFKRGYRRHHLLGKSVPLYYNGTLKKIGLIEPLLRDVDCTGGEGGERVREGVTMVSFLKSETENIMIINTIKNAG